MKVRWTRAALADVDAIQDYIAKEDPRRAFEIAREIRRRAESLVQHAERGRRGRMPGTRELVLGDLPWIIIYRVEGTRPEILRIRHGRQRWPERRRS